MRRLFAAYSGPLAQSGGPTIVMFGLIGRAPMAMLSIGFVAAAAEADPKMGYAIGGAAAAAYSFAAAFFGPAIGRLVDRRGQLPLARVLAVVACFAAALAVGSLHFKSMTPLFIPLAGLVGATQPNIGSLTRSRWAELGERVPNLESAQALESINDEVSFLLGPAVVAILASVGFVGMPILVSMLLLMVGAIGITSSWSLPAPHPHSTGVSWRLEFPAGIGLLLSVGALGGALGAAQVLQLAYCSALGLPKGAALVYLVNSGASLVGAIVIGAQIWVVPVRRRFTCAMLVYAIGVIPSALVDGYWQFVIASTLSGIAIAPTFIQSNALVAEVTSAHSRTSAFTVLVSASAVGIAFGAAVAGLAITSVGADIARLILLPLAGCAATAAIVTDAFTPRTAPPTFSTVI